MKRLICLLTILLLLSSCEYPPASDGSSLTDYSVSETSAEEVSSVEDMSTEESLPEMRELSDSDFVRIKDYLLDSQIVLFYATENNFTGHRIYDFDEPWLRYGTVKKLLSVQHELSEQGLYIKFWDAFRPTSAQFELWEICPDPTYVSDPNKGFSTHSRGHTVDITLVDSSGREVTMPTAFDDFTELADRDYSDCTPESAKNALLLENTMKKYGFRPYRGEWWHFSDTDD